MSNPSGKDAFAFVKDFLTTHKTASYAEVREAASAAGHSIYPIVYGRAQLLLGYTKAKRPAKPAAARPAAALPSVTPRPASKPAASKPARAASAPAPGRRPGRPAKSSAALGIESLVDHIRGVERERDQLRSTLEKLRGLLAGL
ncbi:MAG: hypothetical protein IT457_09180 [Planctomycetes bacterium]|nr:hypothetical protein [Planctomycetota bacterium]